MELRMSQLRRAVQSSSSRTDSEMSDLLGKRRPQSKMNGVGRSLVTRRWTTLLDNLLGHGNKSNTANARSRVKTTRQAGSRQRSLVDQREKLKRGLPPGTEGEGAPHKKRAEHLSHPDIVRRRLLHNT